MSEENLGELYPQTSELLKLSKCLPSDCNEVGDEVIIETKFNTVKGLIHSIDSNGNLKLSYNAVDAGFPDCYQLQQCDVISIRCFNCCDDRYFKLEDCSELTCDIISAALGASSPKLVGNIFLYSGDINEPDCLWKWNGLNDIGQPSNWIDQYGDLSAQFENLDTDPAQLCAFLIWLSAQFTGAGIAFNVSQYCDSIIVTVGDGTGVAPATFTYSYSGGRISLDANDGSGRKDANVIVRGAGPPTEPYNWFFYINTNTGGVFINNDGDAELLGIIDLEGSNSCADIIACVAENIEAGEPDPDRWAMPQVTTSGSTWIIESVVYKPGETTLSANFAACSSGATTLDELVSALNVCENNPAGWVWVNSGGVLTLCTPAGTNVLTVTYDVGSGSQVINFNGVPTVAGEDRVDLCKELADCIIDRGLLDAHIQSESLSTIISELTSYADIEAAYADKQSATVIWVDEKGYNRVSLKHSSGVWSHNFQKRIILDDADKLLIYDRAGTDLVTDLTITEETFDILTVPGVTDILPEKINRLFVTVVAVGGNRIVLSMISPSTGSLSTGRDSFFQINRHQDSGIGATSVTENCEIEVTDPSSVTVKAHGGVTWSAGTPIDRTVKVYLRGFE